MTTQDVYTPRSEHHFTFGLWTVGNAGRDPFGDPVRATLTPTRIVEKLAELGAYGVNLHDNDLVPRDASPAEWTRIVADFKRALDDHGIRVPMATTNLFGDPVFRDILSSAVADRRRPAGAFAELLSGSALSP